MRHFVYLPVFRFRTAGALHRPPKRFRAPQQGVFVRSPPVFPFRSVPRLCVACCSLSMGSILKCDRFRAYQKADYATALSEWRPLAEYGHAVAQAWLGYMYSLGQGAPQDYAEAVRWYRKAADQGVAVAQGSLGFMYRLGQGVPQDYAE